MRKEITGYDRTIQAFKGAIRDGAHLKISAEDRNIAGIYYGTEKAVDRHLAKVFPAVKRTESDGRVIVRPITWDDDHNPILKEGERVTPVSRQAISAKRKRAFHRLMMARSAYEKRRIPWGTFPVSKPVPKDSLIKRHASRGTPVYVLVHGIKEGKSVSQIEAESGLKFNTPLRRRARRLGVEVEDAGWEKYNKIVEEITTEKNPWKIQKLFNGDEVNWNFVCHHILGPNSLLITFSQAVSEAYGMETIIRGSEALEMGKLLRSVRIPWLERSASYKNGRPDSRVRAFPRRYLDNFSDAFPDYADRLAEGRRERKLASQQVQVQGPNDSLQFHVSDRKSKTPYFGLAPAKA